MKTRPALALLLLLVLAAGVLPALAAQSGKGELIGPSEWSEPYNRYLGQSQQMQLDSEFRRATFKEGPFARLNRVAQDYVYRLGKNPKDEGLVRRLISDGLKPVETYESPDGTAAAVFQDVKTGHYIIAFRGTDMGEDWLRNYGEAKHGAAIGTSSYGLHHKVFDRWAEQYGKDGHLEVTGHSRGGGMAQVFTSVHGARVARTVAYQSPGVDESVHRRYEKIPPDQRGENFLFVSTDDAVSDVGGDHLGPPKVFLFTGKDVESKDSFYGHSAFATQPEGLKNDKGAAYRNDGDGRLVADIDYFDYRVQVRGSALVEALQRAGEVSTGAARPTMDPAQVKEFLQKNGRPPEDSDLRKKYPEVPPRVAQGRKAPRPAAKPAPAPRPSPSPAAPATGALRVKVVDGSTGKAIPGATVEMDGRAHAVPAGGVRLTVPADQDLYLAVSAPGYAGRTAGGRVAPGQGKVYTAKLTRQQGKLKVIIQDSATGRPVPRATVTLGGKALQVAGGSAVLDVPADEDLRLAVQAPGYEPRTAGGRVEPGQTKDYLCRLVPVKAAPAPAPAPRQAAPASPFDGSWEGRFGNDYGAEKGDLRFTLRGGRIQGTWAGPYHDGGRQGRMEGTFSGEVQDKGSSLSVRCTVRGRVAASNGTPGEFQGVLTARMELVQGKATLRDGRFELKGLGSFWMYGKNGAYTGKWGGRRTSP